jgi:SAM-dependent methyltransferase
VTLLDRILQRWRIAKASRWIPDGSRVLDVGCGDGALFRQVPWIREYVGIDPGLVEERRTERCALWRGSLPGHCPTLAPVDVLTMLAVLEHVAAPALPELVQEVAALLVEGGRLVLTVPDARVDRILDVLAALRLVSDDDMKAHEHHGYDASRTRVLFEDSFRLVAHERFQLGLNNLFVFERRASKRPAPTARSKT